MPIHTHEFIETYNGLVGFGLDRETDEHTVIWHLQKFSDDALVKTLAQRMTNDELERVFNLLSEIMRKHLTEPEYHRLFLKEEE
jgi:hypothetical protein